MGTDSAQVDVARLREAFDLAIAALRGIADVMQDTKPGILAGVAADVAEAHLAAQVQA